MAQMTRAQRRALRKKKILRNRIIFALICLLLLALLIFGVVRLVGWVGGLGSRPAAASSQTESSPYEGDELDEGAQTLLPDGPADAVSAQSGLLVLANANVALPEDYTVELATADDQTGKQLAAEAADAYREMSAAALQAGVTLTLCSGYRTLDRQRELYEKAVSNWVAEGCTEEEAAAKAAQEIPAPGHSDHNTGLGADISSPDHPTLDTAFAQSDAFGWLQENAAQYGFVLRYPQNKTAITGVSYQPWHYRYVGREAAAVMAASGICLEEYQAV